MSSSRYSSFAWLQLPKVGDIPRFVGVQKNALRTVYRQLGIPPVFASRRSACHVRVYPSPCRDGQIREQNPRVISRTGFAHGLFVSSTYVYRSGSTHEDLTTNTASCEEAQRYGACSLGGLVAIRRSGRKAVCRLMCFGRWRVHGCSCRTPTC